MLPAAVATHPLAIAGLVCGVLGIFCCCCGPLFSTAGAVSSAVALSRIKREPERWTGRNLALVGLILALVGYVIFGLGLIFNQGGGGIHLKPQIPWM
jgi:hypothetical protein